MVKVIILDDQDDRTSITQICRLDLKQSGMSRMGFLADVNHMVAQFIKVYNSKKGGEKP